MTLEPVFGAHMLPTRPLSRPQPLQVPQNIHLLLFITARAPHQPILRARTAPQPQQSCPCLRRHCLMGSMQFPMQYHPASHLSPRSPLPGSCLPLFAPLVLCARPPRPTSHHVPPCHVPPWRPNHSVTTLSPFCQILLANAATVAVFPHAAFRPPCVYWAP